MDAVAADRAIVGDGSTCESDWARWLRRLAPPPLPPEALDARARLVVVAPHPDDEILACGGLVTRHHREGGAVRVIAVTDGEASHPDDPRWTPAQLAARRRAESERGLRQLGVAPERVVRLGLPDTAVSTHAAALHAALDRLLRAGDVVVSTWSLDGHADHDATGAAAESVCQARGLCLLQAPVWMWHWSAPAQPGVPWSRLRALPLAGEARARKAKALAEHETQHRPRAAAEGPVLGPAILARAARDAEYFFV